MELRSRTEGGPPRGGGVLKAAALAAALACAPALAHAAWDASNTVTVVDTSPVNWLSITWNTMEELVRVDQNGNTVANLAESWKWVDPKTLEVHLRKGVKFQDGEPFNAAVFRKSFDHVQGWEIPHPPGPFMNFDKSTKLDVVDDYTVRFTFPAPDGAAIMKFRAMHVGSSAFWDKVAFVDEERKSAERNW